MLVIPIGIFSLLSNQQGFLIFELIPIISILLLFQSCSDFLNFPSFPSAPLRNQKEGWIIWRGTSKMNRACELTVSKRGGFQINFNLNIFVKKEGSETNSSCGYSSFPSAPLRNPKEEKAWSSA